MTYFKQEYLQFFIELAANNHKDWFDLNRKRYEDSVKKPFANFVQSFVDEVAKDDKRYKELKASECIFRINRDIRFSKDKTPYKLYCSAAISPNGKKSDAVHGIYFELTPESVRVYGGIYEIDKERLNDLREGIAKKSKEFRVLIENKEFVNLFGEIQGEKNKILSPELKRSAELEPLIYNKQFYVFTEFPASIITTEKLLPTLLECYNTILPLEHFFNQFIERK